MSMKNRKYMNPQEYINSLNPQELEELQYKDLSGLVNWDRAKVKATPPVDFVLPGLPLGKVGSIVATGGTGKGYVSFELCLGIAVAKDIMNLGIKSTGNKVLYISAEDDQDILEHRVASLIDHLTDEEFEIAKEKIAIQSISGYADLQLIDQDANKNQYWIDRLENACKNRRLVIIDTLRRFHRAEENDSGAMSYLLAILEEIAKKTRCSILFTHHISKGGSSRGSTVLHANIRWQIFLEAMTEKESVDLCVSRDVMHNFVKINSEMSKMNYDAKQGDLWLRRVEGGILIPAVFDLVGNNKKDQKKKEEKKEKEKNDPFNDDDVIITDKEWKSGLDDFLE